MTRAEFAALPGDQHVSAYITFNHGPDRAAIHHDIKDASVRYTLSRYPTFESIRITRAGCSATERDGREYAKKTATRA
jgi:hypothetical protein